MKSTDKKILTSTWQEDMATMMDTGEKIFNHEHFRIKSGMCLQFLRTFKLLKKKTLKKNNIKNSASPARPGGETIIS